MSKAVRQFSLVDKIVLDAPGNVFKRAIALGNADNDPLGVSEPTLNSSFLSLVSRVACSCTLAHTGQ
jgi:hypothetical protein